MSANVRGALVLAAAVLLAMRPPLLSLFTRTWVEARSTAAWADASFAKMRSAVRPGERIGLLVPSLGRDAEIEFWYCAQYALAPGLVEPIMVGECMQPDDRTRCRMARSARLAIAHPKPAWVLLAQQKLGAKTVGWAGPVLIMEAVPP